MKNKRLLIALFALMLLAAGCGGQSAEEALLEEILENSGEDIGNVDINTDDGDFSLNIEGEDGEDISISGGGDDDDFTMTVEGEDGETFSFGGGEIPEGLQVPIADGGDVISSFSSNSDKSVTLNYPASEFDQLVSFYDSQLGSGDSVSRFESSYSTDDGNMRNVSWTDDDEGNWNVSVGDCYGTGGDLDSVCVTIFEFSS